MAALTMHLHFTDHDASAPPHGAAKVKQPAVSTALTSLAEAGYVVPLQREGLEPGRYALAGTSRIIFD